MALSFNLCTYLLQVTGSGAQSEEVKLEQVQVQAKAGKARVKNPTTVGQESEQPQAEQVVSIVFTI